MIECFRESARRLGIPLSILVADCTALSASYKGAADKAYLVPRCTDPEFVPIMLDICSKEEVALIVPTIDTELEILSVQQGLFQSIGSRVSISSPAVVRTCRNKLETSRFLLEIGAMVPRTAQAAEVFRDASGWQFPLILKPTGGSSSIGISIVQSVQELKTHENLAATHIAQELCTGPEYTVNCFFGTEGLCCAVPHLRIEVRGGEVSKGLTQRVPALQKAAALLGAAWKGKAFGALCFQAILQENGEALLFEINARFGGGYPLAHRAGAPFTQWLLEIMAGHPSSAHDNWRDNVLMLRYDAAFFDDDPVI